MLEILYIVNGSGLSKNIGGSLKRTLEISTRLSRHHHVTLLTTKGVASQSLLANNNIDVMLLRASIFQKIVERGLKDRLIGYFVSFFDFLRNYKKYKHYDVVYSDSDYFCDIFPASILKRTGKARKWIAMIHHVVEENQQLHRNVFVSKILSFQQKIMFSIISRNASRVFVYDTDVGDRVEQFFVDQYQFRGVIEKVHNGVDHKAIRRTKNYAKVYDAIVVGGMRPNKGLYDVVDIWEKVTLNRPYAKLAIVGASFYLAYLEREIQQRFLENNIFLTGGLEHNEAIDYLHKSRMLISPSYEEGWGIAICEAQAAYVPVIAYSLPVYLRLFGDSIHTVPVGEKSSMANMIIKQLEHEQDPIIEQAYANSLKYNWDIVATREQFLFEATCCEN